MATSIPTNQTIDDVIAQMDQVIERCIRERSKLGYFAVLYRNVTVKLRDAIAAGRSAQAKLRKKCLLSR